MGRLTYLKNGRPCVLVNGAEVFGPVAERLHAYEETGYEPCGVHELSDRCAKMALERGQRQLEVAFDALSPEDRHELEHDTYGPLHRKIGTWMKADSEGRLLVLPCKVGGKVFRASWPSGDCVTEIKINRRGYHFKCWWGWFHKKDIGKTVFRTREEAEAALKGAADGDA